VVTPTHDYYAQTASGQQEIPRFLRRWISPQEPPSKNVVSSPSLPCLRHRAFCLLSLVHMVVVLERDGSCRTSLTAHTQNIYKMHRHLCAWEDW